jgi:hypothetical protein
MGPNSPFQKKNSLCGKDLAGAAELVASLRRGHPRSSRGPENQDLALAWYSVRWVTLVAIFKLLQENSSWLKPLSVAPSSKSSCAPALRK